MSAFVEFEGALFSAKEAEMMKDLGIDKEPESWPAKVFIDMRFVESVMEAKKDGKPDGTSIYTRSGNAFWVNETYEKVCNELKRWNGL